MEFFKFIIIFSSGISFWISITFQDSTEKIVGIVFRVIESVEINRTSGPGTVFDRCMISVSFVPLLLISLLLFITTFYLLPYIHVCLLCRRYFIWLKTGEWE